MKKILIVTHFMYIGGVERALLGLLDEIDYKKYDVSLFLFRHEGELYSLIPKEVHILPKLPGYEDLACPITDVIRKKHFLMAASRLYGKLKARRYDHVHHYDSSSQVEIEYSHKYTKWLLAQIDPDVTYDLAISFLTPHYFVSEKVHAKKKIAWIHTDYSFIHVDQKSELRMWSAYDNIVAISEECLKAFVKCFPTLSNNVILIENLLDVKYLQNQAELDILENIRDKHEIVLLSIGRFCKAKNFDQVPEICKLIIEAGIPVVWYLIGYGEDEECIRKRIIENDMQEHVIILGKKENPYPYIKQCDWYIQPSRYEGKAMTVREAQALHKPVIITNYPTAKSQLIDGYDGVIVPLENKECAKAISKTLVNHELKEKLIHNTYHVDYSNKDEIKKLYALMGDSE